MGEGGEVEREDRGEEVVEQDTEYPFTDRRQKLSRNLI